MTQKKHSRNPIIHALVQKKNVLAAVMLRDMRTRFFNHGLGFIIVPLWPLAHMGVIITIHVLAGKASPYGQSTTLFYATGIVPTLMFLYISRFMGYSLIQNRAMMAFPIVKPIDVMTGRACLEITSSVITLTLIMIILLALGNNPWPNDLETAVLAYITVIFLAFGIGILVGILGLAFPLFLTVWQLLSICLYISSGTFFVASNLPHSAATVLSYNPVTVCVEWMRTAYYETYSDKLVAPFYVISFGAVALLLGLSIDRFFRRQLADG